MQQGSQELSVLEKTGYSLGDCAANFVFQTQIMFLMGFYTDVFGIAASTAGYIFLLSRLWDAFNDPLMGALADRTDTRWGKFRPWILITAVPFAILFVLCYTVPDLSLTGKIVWAVITYNLLMMIYTANNIPYSALTGVMTGDRAERGSLVTWRFVFAMIAQFVVQTYTLSIVAAFGGQADPAGAWQKTIALWALIAVVFFFITFATTRERVKPDPQFKSSLRGDLADLLGNRNWVALAVATVFIFICLSMRGGSTYYYFQYYIREGEVFGRTPSWQDLFGWFNGLGTLTTIAGVLLSKPLAMRFGNRDVFRVSLFLTAVCMAAFYFLPPTAVQAILLLQMLLQFIYGTTIPLLWAMMADVADFTEWKTGRRATAMTFALTVFALKLGLSLGGAFQGWLLDYYQYAPNAAQSEHTLEGIRLLMSIFPAISFFLGVGALLYYKIDKPTELQMHEELTQRRRRQQASY
ncbi:MFS transporter [Bythopirellula goksoeyrii]|uniref:Inner membrane symporter YicJ n=1 Tax=Bythopirellula goksoeyrii TaxID=1400387 RepID=A0A5B9QBP9_9BACT|nr:MFS transporter [Bythopirellula goksoeyrii]QEG36434.1 Inner membrane symporter YicJ [Bythopirellula goksoeyrii]